MSIPQTFINNKIDNKLDKDDKDKRVNLKCQDFYEVNHTMRSDDWSTIGSKCSPSYYEQLVCF